MSLILALVVQRPFPGCAQYLHRVVVCGPLLVSIAMVQLVHRVALGLDHVVFPQFRRRDVVAPVFVLGLPRSGTTHMHRLLAADQQFTTFSTLECFLAPSLVERHLLRCCKRLDRKLGSPIKRVVVRMERRLTERMEDLHPTSLDAPEEDYLCLMPWLACFLLIVPFPEAQWLHTIARDQLSADKRLQLQHRYVACLQRHLHFHDPHNNKTLLSKNAAFAGMATFLLDAFPDARILICRRDPLQAIDSQFRVLAAARPWFGLPANDPQFKEELLQTLEVFVTALADLQRGQYRQQCHLVSLSSLSSQPRETLHEVFAFLAAEPSADVNTRLMVLESGPRHQVSTPVRAPDAPSSDANVVRRFSSCRVPEQDSL